MNCVNCCSMVAPQNPSPIQLMGGSRIASGTVRRYSRCLTGFTAGLSAMRLNPPAAYPGNSSVAL